MAKIEKEDVYVISGDYFIYLETIPIDDSKFLAISCQSNNGLIKIYEVSINKTKNLIYND